MSERIPRGRRAVRRGVVAIAAASLTAIATPASGAVDGTAWIDQFGTSLSDHAYDVAIDGAGNAHVAGEVYVPTGSRFFEASIRTYDPRGDLVRNLSFGTDKSDSARAIAVTTSGDLVVAGHTFGVLTGSSAGLYDGFIRVLDPTGAERWTVQFGTAAYDYPEAVAVDDDGNIYVAGHTDSIQGDPAAGYSEAFVWSYDGEGTLRWARSFGTTASDFAYDLALGATGDVYVAGYTAGVLPGQPQTFGNQDIFVRAYDASGTERWTRQFGTTSSDYGYAVATDASGNVHVGGRALGDLIGAGGPVGDAVVRTFGPTGNALRTTQFGEEGDTVRSIAFSPSGSMVIAGETVDAVGPQPSLEDVVVRVLDDGGAVVRERALGTAASEVATDVAVDDAGHQYVVGDTQGALGGTASGGTDGFVARLNDPPSIDQVAAPTAVEGQPVAINVTATDPDGDPLSFSASPAPMGLVSEGGGRFTWTPGIDQAGSHEVRFVVQDPDGATDIASATITVAEGAPRTIALVTKPRRADRGDRVRVIVSAPPCGQGPDPVTLMAGTRTVGTGELAAGQPMVFKVKVKRTTTFVATSPDMPDHDHHGGTSASVKVRVKR